MRRRMSTVFGAALAGLVLAGPAPAQGPGPGGPPPGQGGGFGGGGFGGGGGFSRPGGRFGGGFGGGGFGGVRQSPLAFGTVSAVDAADGTLTLTTPNGHRVVHVGPDAQVVTQQAVSIADLKVGDRVTLRSGPAGLTEPRILAGQPPAGLPGAGDGFGPGGGGFGGGAGRFGGQNTGGQGFVMASGTLKTLPTKKDSRLTIALGPDAQLVLKLASNAKATRYASVALSSIKAGDRIVAAGPMEGDGTLTASVVGVNFPAGGFGGGPGGFGGGGFGGGPGGQGFGGRRGGFPPADGFGGPPPGPDGFGGPPPPTL